LFGEIFWDKVSGTICSGTDWNQDPPVTGNMVLKITQVLASSKRIQVSGKDSVKVTVKFIGKGLHFQQTESGFSLEWEQGGGGGEKDTHTHTERERERERERETHTHRHFLFLMQGMGTNTQNAGPHFLSHSPPTRGSL
jgi:hypothetical protein